MDHPRCLHARQYLKWQDVRKQGDDKIIRGEHGRRKDTQNSNSERSPHVPACRSNHQSDYSCRKREEQRKSESLQHFDEFFFSGIQPVPSAETQRSSLEEEHHKYKRQEYPAFPDKKS